MILSRSADYGLRALVYLSCSGTSRYVPLHEIAAPMRTPQFLLARILQRLVKGGVVVSMKGHHGGFRLRRHPREITAADVIELIDGPIRAMHCVGTADCALAGDCSLVDLFARVERAVQATLKSTTLEELTRPYAVIDDEGVVRFAARRTEVVQS